MRWVSYTRAVSCRKGEENPPDIISRQNENIEAYMKEHGFTVSKNTATENFLRKHLRVLMNLCRRGCAGILMELLWTPCFTVAGRSTLACCINPLNFERVGTKRPGSVLAMN